MIEFIYISNITYVYINKVIKYKTGFEDDSVNTSYVLSSDCIHIIHSTTYMDNE